ncbi:hypothetical protein FRC11_008992, partial [Ceratobasidium sp. 423]
STTGARKHPTKFFTSLATEVRVKAESTTDPVGHSPAPNTQSRVLVEAVASPPPSPPPPPPPPPPAPIVTLAPHPAGFSPLMGSLWGIPGIPFVSGA